MTRIKGTLIRKADGGYEGTIVPSSSLPDDLPPIPLHGVADLTARVDQRSKAVLAAEEASASKIRVEMLRGQTMAEEERYIELNKRVMQELEEELKRVTNG